MTRLESWQRKWERKAKLKRNSEETKELDDRLKTRVVEEKRVKNISRVSDLGHWKNVSTTVKNGE